jgi:hypothetical protein
VSASALVIQQRRPTSTHSTNSAARSMCSFMSAVLMCGAQSTRHHRLMATRPCHATGRESFGYKLGIILYIGRLRCCPSCYVCAALFLQQQRGMQSRAFLPVGIKCYFSSTPLSLLWFPTFFLFFISRLFKPRN